MRLARGDFVNFSHLVSIHAPVRGATPNMSERVLATLSFNPRTREGCDRTRANLPRATEVSIHAPVRGATITRLKESGDRISFNPRTREGCDFTIKVVYNGNH